MNGDQFSAFKWSHQFFSQNLIFLTLVETALMLVCILGDYFIFDSGKLVNFVSINLNVKPLYVKALMDNGSHLIIGVLSWIVVCYPRIDVHGLAGVALLSSIIDIDHFINAKSFYLVNAISMENRPFLHNSLLMLIVNCILFSYLVACDRNKSDWSIIFFISWFSHHVRDGNRHGMWFGSIYTTKPFPDGLYLSTIAITPLVLRFFKLFNWFQWYQLIFNNNNPNLIAKSQSQIV